MRAVRGGGVCVCPVSAAGVSGASGASGASPVVIEAHLAHLAHLAATRLCDVQACKRMQARPHP